MEAVFEKRVHLLMRAAKRHKGVFLYNYFERVYEESVGEEVSMFIGMHELCHLTSDKPCDAGNHLDCLARKTINAYDAIKVPRDRSWVTVLWMGVGAIWSVTSVACLSVCV